MRILIVCDFLFKYGSQQARSLAQIGHDVSMLSRSHALEFGGSTAERNEIIDVLRREGIHSFVVPGRVRSISAVPAMLQIRRELRRWRPQIVHVHENFDPRLLALTSGYRTVFTVHDPVEHLGARSFTRAETWIFDRWFQRAERFVVHGDALAEELAPFVDRSRIIVIPHGVAPRSDPSLAQSRRASSCSAGSSSTRAWRCSSRRCDWCGSGVPRQGWSWPARARRPGSYRRTRASRSFPGTYQRGSRNAVCRCLTGGAPVHPGQPERRRCYGNRAWRSGGGERSRRPARARL